MLISTSSLSIMVVIILLFIRKTILPHKEKIKKKLKKNKLRHYTVSYSIRKQRLANTNDTITRTIIGLDDER